MTPQDQQNQTPIQQVGGAETIREQDKIMLVLSYLSCLCLIPLLTVKDSPYVQWHAKQGLVINVLGGVIVAVLSAVPVIQLVACLLWPALLVVDIMAIMKALKGERWRVPVAADLSEKF